MEISKEDKIVFNPVKIYTDFDNFIVSEFRKLNKVSDDVRILSMVKYKYRILADEIALKNCIFYIFTPQEIKAFDFENSKKICEGVCQDKKM